MPHSGATSAIVRLERSTTLSSSGFSARNASQNSLEPHCL